MKREEIKRLMDKGYHVVINGVPKKIDKEIWEYLDQQTEDSCVLVLLEMLTWDDDELAKIENF
ncbi:MAG: hypothetical protein ACI35Z_08225 [Sphingobacterium hotanense]